MLRINIDACTGCGLCEQNCALDAIHVVDGIAQIDQENCNLCGGCVDFCEAAALFMEGEERRSEVEKLAEWSGIWIYAEYRNGRLAPVTLELLGEGRRLADARGTTLAAVLFTDQDSTEADDFSNELISHGADTVYLAENPLFGEFYEDVYAAVLADMAGKYKPEIILAGATAIGRSFIPRVAATLKTGLTADCTKLEIQEDGALLQSRPAFSGNVMAAVLCPGTRPQMATVHPSVMKAAKADPNRSGEIVRFAVPPQLLKSGIKVNRFVALEKEGVNLDEADIVVAGGRGMENEEGFRMVEELAEVLGGAVAASRAAVDSGWVSSSRMVGQTGQTVRPKVYIACGISGAIQHTIGMQSAETIIAINRDPEAPVFDIATYGVVGDAFEIIPRLIEKIKMLQGEESKSED
ncbi:MAG: FAD-binding protein [Desulfurivibrionaceae bacterium]